MNFHLPTRNLSIWFTHAVLSILVLSHTFFNVLLNSFSTPFPEFHKKIAQKKISDIPAWYLFPYLLPFGVYNVMRLTGGHSNRVQPALPPKPDGDEGQLRTDTPPPPPPLPLLRPSVKPYQPHQRETATLSEVFLLANSSFKSISYILLFDICKL